MVDCCKHSKTDKNCIRSSDKKSFKLPRKFSKKKCKNPKGFTMKSSCAPYKDCYSNKRKNKRSEKRSENNKNLTKLGKEWVKLASEDMKKRELEFFKNTIKKNDKKKNTKKKRKRKNTKKGGKKSKKPVVLPKLRPISYKNKKYRYHIKDPQKKRILAIEEGIQSESKNKRTKREAAIAKKARFNVLRIYRKNNNYKECKRLTDDMKYISKKYDLGKTKNICLK